MDSIQVDRKILRAALDALGERCTPVYSAREIVGGRIEIWLCGRTAPVIWQPPASKKTTTTPRTRKKKAKKE